MGKPTADNCSTVTDMLQIFADIRHICPFGKGRQVSRSSQIRIELSCFVSASQEISLLHVKEDVLLN